MRITTIKVTGLLGHFDYTIDLNLIDRITILIAPNGYGKTKILEMLHALFNDDFTVFERIPFNTYEIWFEGERHLKVSHQADNNKIFLQIILDGKPIDLELGEDRYTWLRFLEEFAPVRRVGNSKWLDSTSRDTLTTFEAIRRYADRIPEPFRKRLNESGLKILSREVDLKTRFLRTQRLDSHQRNKERVESESYREGKMIASVIIYQAKLRTEIQKVLAASAEQSQALDSTFPRRLIDRIQERSESFEEIDFDKQVHQLNELNEKRREIADAGLLEKQPDNDPIPNTNNSTMANVLAMLAEDTRAKLEVFDDLHGKIKLFKEIINKRFQFKRVVVNRDKGYLILNKDGKELPLEHLSSGEQHELVLFYELLFETNSNTLIIIDEPELSLHIEWQRHFLSSLRSIIEVSPFDVLIATHSPDIIQAEVNLLVDLGQMVNIDGE